MKNHYTLIIKEEAKLDITDGFEWYESKQQKLGGKFKTQVRKAFKTILGNPKGYQIVTGNYRQATISKFPYVIVFEVFESEVVAYAVFHTRQDPTKKNR